MNPMEDRKMTEALTYTNKDMNILIRYDHFDKDMDIVLFLLDFPE